MDRDAGILTIYKPGTWIVSMCPGPFIGGGVMIIDWLKELYDYSPFLGWCLIAVWSIFWGWVFSPYGPGGYYKIGGLK